MHILLKYTVYLLQTLIKTSAERNLKSNKVWRSI